MRLDFHYTPHKNWMNDPNGLCYFKGHYHLYYQHNPLNPFWGNMSWGHAISTDLINWTDQVVAMVPSREEDSHEYRDPKLFMKNDKYYFVVAARRKSCGGVLFYESSDLKTWSRYREHIFDDRGIMWECPDYFEVNGQGILIYSAIGINHNGKKVAIGWSTYDFETGDFGDFNLMDLGNTFYAP